MTLEILIDEMLLKTMVGLARDEYKQLFELQQNAVIQRFGQTKPEASEAIETADRAALLFAGSYYAVKSKLQTARVFGFTVPDEFKKAYYCYAASEAVVQYFAAKGLHVLGPKQIPGFKLELSLRDYNTIAEVIEQLTERLRGTRSPQEVPKEIVDYFAFVRSYALARMQTVNGGNSLSVVEGLVLKGTFFEVNGIKVYKRKMENSGEDESLFQKEPTQIKLEKELEKKDVVGNQEAIAAVEASVHNLLAYDADKKMNPYLLDGGFQQFLLLVGDSGTGKTMVFKYGISEAQRIARANGLDFAAVSLDFDDAYQDGPVKILKYQLKCISDADKPHLVFLDEMEGKFPARNSAKTGRFEEKTIREFLDFANGLGYPNRGNYVILGASNLPEKIDKAIRSRLSKGTYMCEGPRTAEEKARVLYNNLLEGINKGYVKISDWRTMGALAKDLGLSGRDLEHCARSVLEASRSSTRPAGFHRMSFDEKLKTIQSGRTTICNDTLARQMYGHAEKQASVQEANRLFEEERKPNYAT